MTESFVLSKTVGDLVKEALRDARIIAQEQSISDADFQNGLDALNNVSKLWQTKGVHLWLQERAVLPLIVGQKKYTLGPSGAKCGTESTFYNTTLSAAEASGQTVLSVASVSNMVSAQNIGIELDDGTRQWTTIGSVGSSTVTVDDALTGAAASGNTVYFYTTQISKPLRIYNVMYSSSLGTGDETPAERWSRQEYMMQPDKDSQGTVVQWYYNPKSTDGDFYVWQTASNVDSALKFDYREQLSAYTSSSDTLSIPEEYYIPLKWGIAADVGPSYGVPDQRQLLLERKAEQTLELALDNDAEDDSVLIQPDFD